MRLSEPPEGGNNDRANSSVDLEVSQLWFMVDITIVFI